LKMCQDAFFTLVFRHILGKKVGQNWKINVIIGIQNVGKNFDFPKMCSRTAMLDFKR